MYYPRVQTPSPSLIPREQNIIKRALLLSPPSLLTRFSPFSSFDIVAVVPEEPPGDGEAQHGPGQVELDDGPEPEAAERGGALHDFQVAVAVGDVDEVAAAGSAHGEEEGLAEGFLVAVGQAGDEPGAGVVRVQGEEEYEEDCF